MSIVGLSIRSGPNPSQGTCLTFLYVYMDSSFPYQSLLISYLVMSPALRYSSTSLSFLFRTYISIAGQVPLAETGFPMSQTCSFKKQSLEISLRIGWYLFLNWHLAILDDPSHHIWALIRCPVADVQKNVPLPDHRIYVFNTPNRKMMLALADPGFPKRVNAKSQGELEVQVIIWRSFPRKLHLQEASI